MARVLLPYLSEIWHSSGLNQWNTEPHIGIYWSNNSLSTATIAGLSDMNPATFQVMPTAGVILTVPRPIALSAGQAQSWASTLADLSEKIGAEAATALHQQQNPTSFLEVRFSNGNEITTSFAGGDWMIQGAYASEPVSAMVAGRVGPMGTESPSVIDAVVTETAGHLLSHGPDAFMQQVGNVLYKIVPGSASPTTN